MPESVTQPAGPIGVLADLSDGEWTDLLRDFEIAPEVREVAADVLRNQPPEEANS